MSFATKTLHQRYGSKFPNLAWFKIFITDFLWICVDRGNLNLYVNSTNGYIETFFNSTVELLERIAKNQHVKRKNSFNFISKTILHFKLIFVKMNDGTYNLKK